jgi:CheY-like chemotaxis protein
MQSDNLEDRADRSVCRLKALLCLDNNNDVRDIVTFLLSQVGYKVTSTTTGAKCLSRAQQEDFDLILLDAHLPDGSGVDLCKQLRGFTPYTAIVFYTFEVEQEARLQALGAGASAYLSMPVDNLEFLNLLSSYQDSPSRHVVVAGAHADEQVIHLLSRSKALVSRGKDLHRAAQVLSKQLQALYADSDEVIKCSRNASEVSPITSTRPTGQRKSDHE